MTTEEDRRIDPDVELIGDRLQALIDIQNAYKLANAITDPETKP